MVGARWEHDRIVGNTSAALMSGLRRQGSPCGPFAASFWLKQRFLRLAVFPDTIVRCGGLERGATSLDDLVVLFEVVSRGSVQRDRHEKWLAYQRLPSLQHYVLIERDRAAADVWDRTDMGWTPRPRLEVLDALLLLPAIGFELPLSEIYRDIFSD